MDLVLITIDEQNKLNPDILVEPLKICNNVDILFELYNTEYNRIIISRRYVDTIGASKVLSALKSLLIVNYSCLSDITLLNHREHIIDEVIKDFIDLDVKCINVDIKQVSYKDFIGLNRFPRIDVEDSMDLKTFDDIQDIVKELKELSSFNIENYVKLNFDRISTCILRCERLIKAYGNLTETNGTISNKLLVAESRLQYLTNELSYVRYENGEIKALNELAKKIFVKYAESIKRYNNVISKSEISDDFIVTDKDRDIMVIYFKELEDINFFRVFDTLFDNLKYIRNYTVKGIVLENSNRTYFNPYKGYKLLSSQPQVNELVLNNKFVKYGNARKVIDILTRQQYHNQILLVLDRSYNENIALQFKNQMTYYLGKKRENYNDMNIPDENFISVYEGAYTDISLLLNNSDKLKDISFKTYCNNHKFVTNLVNICKAHLKSK